MNTLEEPQTMLKARDWRTPAAMMKPNWYILFSSTRKTY
jgi:hypothetical protein